METSLGVVGFSLEFRVGSLGFIGFMSTLHHSNRKSIVGHGDLECVLEVYEAISIVLEETSRNGITNRPDSYLGYRSLQEQPGSRNISNLMSLK